MMNGYTTTHLDPHPCKRANNATRFLLFSNGTLNTVS